MTLSTLVTLPSHLFLTHSLPHLSRTCYHPRYVLFEGTMSVVDPKFHDYFSQRAFDVSALTAVCVCVHGAQGLKWLCHTEQPPPVLPPPHVCLSHNMLCTHCVPLTLPHQHVNNHTCQQQPPPGHAHLPGHLWRHRHHLRRHHLPVEAQRSIPQGQHVSGNQRQVSETDCVGL